MNPALEGPDLCRRTMKLKRLLKDLPDLVVKGSQETEITGITAHSQSVAPGNLFLAKRGGVRNGRDFISQAVLSGAAAIATDLYDPFLQHAVQVIHPDVAALEPVLAERFFQSPSRELFLVGVTGTNGKTTTSYLIRHLFHALNIPSGLLGTVEWMIGETILPARLTTPDLLTGQKMLREMVDCKAKAAVMEVSAHGLTQNRVALFDFDVAIFTNLTPDHLDYYKTMEAYGEAKTKLFSQLDEDKAAVINADDPFSSHLARHCKARLFTYGIEQGDVRAESVTLTLDGLSCTVRHEGKSASLFCPLIGRFNVYNCLAALSVGRILGASLETCTKALSSFVSVPGRMEKVVNARGILVYVDYSHTEDALKNALLTLRELHSGRIVTLFGCGGDRDAEKRPRMGRLAEELSDQVILTSDNPRSEEPLAIIADILKGMKDPEKTFVEPDRKRAIEWALLHAREGEILLLAGKGHETYQIFSSQTVTFDDRKVAASAAELDPKVPTSLN